MTDALFPLLAVRCFFGCGYVVCGLDLYANRSLMEDHYAARHQAQVAMITGRVSRELGVGRAAVYGEAETAN